MKRKIVVNTDSGNCRRLNITALRQMFGPNVTVEFIDGNSHWSTEDCDEVIVCGGDGTLNNALKKCNDSQIYYVPCGTLNEAADATRQICSVGAVNGKPFAYVCATGSFTEIGYNTATCEKQRLKVFAYLPQVFETYRCHEIEAKLNVDGKRYSGKYTLLMVLKSHRCFGFPFNKDYLKTQKCYLLAVKAFGKDSLWNRVRMFFPFFEIFFCGTRPKEKRRWILTPFDNLSVETAKNQTYCVDGEKRLLPKKLNFSLQPLKKPIIVVPPPLVKKPNNKKERATVSRP